MRPRVLLWPLLASILAFLAVAAWHSPAIRSIGYEHEASLALPEDLRSPEEILGWIGRNIRYQPESPSGQGDYWQTPEETLSRGSGDCEDLSLLFMFLCRRLLAVEPRLLVVADHLQSAHNHTIVAVGDAWYDPTEGHRIPGGTPYRVFYDFSYPRSLWMAERYHAGMVQKMRTAAPPAASCAAPGQSPQGGD